MFPDQEESGMLDIFRGVVESGQPYEEPALWYATDWGGGRSGRRAFDMRAAMDQLGFVPSFADVRDGIAEYIRMYRAYRTEFPAA